MSFGLFGSGYFADGKTLQASAIVVLPWLESLIEGKLIEAVADAAERGVRDQQVDELVKMQT